MKIINNNDTLNCHFNTLIDLIEDAEELLIVSPFISSNFNIVPQKHLEKIKRITLLTTLPKLYSEQEKKVGFFLHYLSLAKQYNFNLTIYIDDSLHAKVYIGKSGNNYKAIITSANFTNNGLKTNNEWGIYLENSKQIQNIWDTIIKSPKIYKLDSETIYEYEQIIKSEKISPTQKPDLAYNLQPPVPPIISEQSEITYWLKPVGTQENPTPDSDLYNAATRDINFVVKPKGIKKGDIVIYYAAHRKNIVSVFIVEREYFKNEHRKDFPYSVTGRNLYPYYGAEWPKMNITIDTIRAKFTANEQYKITPKGANNYQCLTQADKMKVTPQYGKFVMQEIDIENKRIASSTIID